MGVYAWAVPLFLALGASAFEDKLLKTASPDDLLVYKNDTTVLVYGTDVTLSPYLFDCQRNLIVKAVTVRLPSATEMPLKLTGKSVGSRNVMIHAMNLVVAEGGSLIDVSGEEGESSLVRARPAYAHSSSGTDGEAGGDGLDGGHVHISAASITGGLLTVKANGGAGGRGQNASDGAVGQNGAMHMNAVDCCKKGSSKDKLKGTTGETGGSGGHGGAGGNGGQPGSVHIKYADAPDTRELLFEVFAEPGRGGAGGVGGAGGAGGLGGPGLPSSCVKVGWFRKRCFLPLAEHGDQGLSGADGSDGEMGLAGQGTGVVTKEGQATWEEVRSNHCGDHLRYELYFADKMFMQGQLNVADAIYSWVESVRGETQADCGAEFGSPWFAQSLQASSRRSLISQGLDFWGKEFDIVPGVSFEALEKAAVAAISMAQSSETAYDNFFSTSVADWLKKTEIKNSLKTQELAIIQAEEEMKKAAPGILEIRPRIRAKDLELFEMQEALRNNFSQCDQKIYEKTVRSKYGFIGNINNLVKFFKGVRTLAIDEYNRHVAWAFGKKDWILGASGAVKMTQLLYKDAQNSKLELIAHKNKALSDLQSAPWLQKAPLLNAQIQDTQNLISSMVSKGFVWKDAVMSKAKDVQDMPNQLQKETRDRLNLKIINDVIALWQDIMPGKELDRAPRIKMMAASVPAAISIWVPKVKECAAFEEEFKKYLKKKDEYQMLIDEHDGLVNEFSALHSSRERAKQSRQTLLKNSAYDPNGQHEMALITDSYKNAKSNVVRVLRMMRSRLNYEFCEDKSFEFNDGRIAQLEGLLSDLVAQRLRRKASRNQGLQMARWSGDSQAADRDLPSGGLVININRESFESEIHDFWQTGDLVFELTRDRLPKGVANVRVAEAQAYAPGLIGNQNIDGEVAQIWIKRTGSSQCIDSKGHSRTFAHKPEIYHSMYSVLDNPAESSLAPVWYTKQVRSDDMVGPAPVGEWRITIPGLSQEDRLNILEFHLHLTLTFTTCETPTCQAVTANATSDSGSMAATVRATRSSSANTDSKTKFFGSAFAVFAVSAMLVGLAYFQKATTRPSLAEEVPLDAVEEEQISRAVRGRSS